MRLTVEQLIHVVGKAILEVLSTKTEDEEKIEDLNILWVLLEERLTQGEIQELYRVTGYSPLHWVASDEFGPVRDDSDLTSTDPDEIPF
jgi:hypothetical protein